MGKKNIDVTEVPDPQILNPHDAILRVTLTAICGSDLHLYGGYIPTMKKGDVLGHEFMGEVVEVGPAVEKLKVGDRVVVPFTIACGHCFFCKKQLWSLCDNTNPNAWMLDLLYGESGSALFGYSHLYAVSAEDKPSMCAFHSPMSVPLKFRMISATNKCSSCRIFFRPDTWRPRIVKSNRETP